jgi:hypothetical protein
MPEVACAGSHFSNRQAGLSGDLSPVALSDVICVKRSGRPLQPDVIELKLN